jgi:hypothetical protein
MVTYLLYPYQMGIHAKGLLINLWVERLLNLYTGTKKA